MTNVEMKQMMEINADVSKAKTMSIVIIHWSTVICHWENRSAIVASLKMACSGGHIRHRPPAFYLARDTFLSRHHKPRAQTAYTPPARERLCRIQKSSQFKSPTTPVPFCGS